MAAGLVPKRRPRDRRGAVVVLVAVTSTVMVGFAAMTIDLGNLCVARSELQRAADAAALAGASVYFSDTGLSGKTSAIADVARQRSATVAIKDPVNGSGVVLDSTDVTLGQHDFSRPTSPLLSVSPWNAVQVKACRTSSSANGPIPLLFANFFHESSAQLTAGARAAIDDHASSYTLNGNTSGTRFMPFTIPKAGYYDLINNGPDVYSYKSNVISGADGIREVLMYPWKWSDTGSSGGSGNFGILDMNRPNCGALDLADQIRTGGATAADVKAQFGTSTLTFYDAIHTKTPNTYSCSGTPGMKTSVQSALSGQIGKVFGFFLNNGVHR